MQQVNQASGGSRKWRNVVVGAALAACAVAGGLGLTAAWARDGGDMHAPESGGHHRHGEAGEPGMPFMAGHMLDRMLDSVKATDDQRAKIHKIVDANQKTHQEQMDAMHAVHEKMLTLMAAPKIDESAAESLRKQGLALHDQGSKRMLQTMLEVGKVLTPEQRAQLAQHIREHGRPHEHHGMMKHDGEHGDPAEHQHGDHASSEPDAASAARP